MICQECGIDLATVDKVSNPHEILPDGTHSRAYCALHHIKRGVEILGINDAYDIMMRYVLTTEKFYEREKRHKELLANIRKSLDEEAEIQKRKSEDKVK